MPKIFVILLRLRFSYFDPWLREQKTETSYILSGPPVNRITGLKFINPSEIPVELSKVELLKSLQTKRKQKDIRNPKNTAKYNWSEMYRVEGRVLV